MSVYLLKVRKTWGLKQHAVTKKWLQNSILTQFYHRGGKSFTMVTTLEGEEELFLGYFNTLHVNAGFLLQDCVRFDCAYCWSPITIESIICIKSDVKWKTEHIYLVFNLFFNLTSFKTPIKVICFKVVKISEKINTFYLTFTTRNSQIWK